MHMKYYYGSLNVINYIYYTGEWSNQVSRDEAVYRYPWYTRKTYIRLEKRIFFSQHFC